MANVAEIKTQLETAIRTERDRELRGMLRVTLGLLAQEERLARLTKTTVSDRVIANVIYRASCAGVSITTTPPETSSERAARMQRESLDRGGKVSS